MKLNRFELQLIDSRIEKLEARKKQLLTMKKPKRGSEVKLIEKSISKLKSWKG